MKEYLGSPLFFTLLALVINGGIRALKTTRIPKSVLPWIALVLGFGAGLGEALASGHAWGVAALEGLKGLASGTGAIATNETLSTVVRGAWPGLADALFGPKAGPSSLPANVPTVSVPADPVPLVIPPPPPKGPIVPLALICFAWGILGGCAASQAADEAIGQLTSYVGMVDPVLHAAYRAELDACGVDVQCANRVDAKWEPIIEASQRVRQVWCAVKPADCPEGAGR